MSEYLIVKNMKKHLLILTSLGAVACCILTVVIFFHGPAAKAAIKYDWKRLKRKLPFMSRSNVKHLIIKNVNLTKQDLELLKTLHNLKRLTINGCGIDDDELQFIEGLTKLEALHLRERSITDTGLIHLESLKNLEQLQLSSNKVTDNGLIHLSKLRKLKRLELNAKKITGNGFLYLRGLKNLRHIIYLSSKVNNEGMKNIAQLKQLQSLEIGWKPPITDESLKYLEENYNLKYFGHPHTVSEDALQEFRNTLLEGRRAARKRGEDVSRDDKLNVSGSRSLKAWQARYNSGPCPAPTSIYTRKQNPFWRTKN